jgi:hypothetical protein
MAQTTSAASATVVAIHTDAGTSGTEGYDRWSPLDGEVTACIQPDITEGKSLRQIGQKVGIIGDNHHEDPGLDGRSRLPLMNGVAAYSQWAVGLDATGEAATDSYDRTETHTITTGRRT